MNLLIYSHYFPPSIGGVETVVFSLASGLARNRDAGDSAFDVTLVTQTPAGNFRDSLLPFRIIRQPALLQLRQLIQQADIVHVAGPALAPVIHGLLARKPVVVEHHGFQTICPTGQLFQEPEKLPCPGHFMAGRHAFCLKCCSHRDRSASIRLWLLTFLRRFLCKHVAVNITPTAWLATCLQLPRSETVHHGLLMSPQIVHLPGIHSGPVLAFLGRLVTTKGVRLLLEACNILHQQKRSFELLVLGDGPERASLEALAQEWHLTSQVRFFGRVGQSQMSELLTNADLVVVPSLGGEVFGMVPAENMLRGIPVLASNLGAFDEVLADAGITFKTGDSADLARQIVRIVDDPALSKRMRVTGRQRVLERFPMSRMIDRHTEIYLQLASKEGSAKPG